MPDLTEFCWPEAQRQRWNSGKQELWRWADVLQRRQINGFKQFFQRLTCAGLPSAEQDVLICWLVQTLVTVGVFNAERAGATGKRRERTPLEVVAQATANRQKTTPISWLVESKADQ